MEVEAFFENLAKSRFMIQQVFTRRIMIVFAIAKTLKFVLGVLRIHDDKFRHALQSATETTTAGHWEPLGRRLLPTS